MLSIIICSINKDLFLQISKNIKNTIGDLDYELIRIDNSERLHISEAYNKGIELSVYPFLLFIHEDVLIRTRDWGTILLDIFKKENKAGLIGVAGSKTKTRTPTGWWENEPGNWVMNLIQHYTSGRVENIYRGFKDGKDVEEVVVIDGVFIAMRKIKGLRYDERLKGFHNYDQAISIRCINSGFKNYVLGKILIEHFSSGNSDDSWLSSTFLFYNLYKKYLPVSVGNKKITDQEKAYSYMRLVNNLIKQKKKKKAIKYWLLFFKSQPFSKKNKRYIKYFLLGRD